MEIDFPIKDVVIGAGQEPAPPMVLGVMSEMPFSTVGTTESETVPRVAHPSVSGFSSQIFEFFMHVGSVGFAAQKLLGGFFVVLSVVV